MHTIKQHTEGLEYEQPKEPAVRQPIAFNSGLPPAPKKGDSGNYWIRFKSTDRHPIGAKRAFSSARYGWKCTCHPDSIQGLPDNIDEGLKLGFYEITGWILLPEPAA